MHRKGKSNDADRAQNTEEARRQSSSMYSIGRRQQREPKSDHSQTGARALTAIETQMPRVRIAGDEPKAPSERTASSGALHHRIITWGFFSPRWTILNNLSLSVLSPTTLLAHLYPFLLHFIYLLYFFISASLSFVQCFSSVSPLPPTWTLRRVDHSSSPLEIQ